MNATPLWGGLTLAILGIAAPVHAQDPPVQDPPKTEIEQLREELAALRNQRNLDQLQIQELEERISQLEQGEDVAPDPLQDPLQDPLLDPALDPSQGSGLTGIGQGNLYNPAITVFADMMGSLSDDSSNEALNRFSLREVELDFRAAIAPIADGVFIGSFHEEIEQMTDGTVDVERNVEIEEGYVDFHTLPGEFRLVAGQFRSSFGRNNLLHLHDLPQVDRPLANDAFFGPEGLITTGLWIEHLVPNPWDSYVNLVAQVVNADSGPESPVLGGPNAENPAFLGRLGWFEDVGQTSSIDLGGSVLWGHSGDSNDMTSTTWGADLTFLWRDPEAADSHSFLVQSEVYYSDIDVDNAFGMFNNNSYGWYAFAQYQPRLNWYAGLRYDYTEFPNSDVRGPMDSDWALSPYITWYVTEFLRLRFEYQHRERDISGVSADEEIFFLNLTAVFGAHPPHPYWVNR